MEYYPRIIEEKLEKWIKRKQAIIIKGPRQVGKTTLLLHLKEKYGGKYITLEKEDILRTFEENPDIFVERFEDKYLFIDEAQYSKKAGKILKLIYDTHPGIKLFVTGSGSFDIKILISKYLVGRGISFELYPLNFEEFLLWKAKDLAKIHRIWKKEILKFIKGESIAIERGFEQEFKSLFEEYLLFGGFPEVVKEKDKEMKKEILKQIYRSYVERDVFFFLNVMHLEKFRNLMRYLSFSLGSMLNISSISSDLGMDYKTISNYLNILVNTYIIELVSPFHKNLITEIKKSNKIYFVDIGLRNAILNNFSSINVRSDKGEILENFILNEFHIEGYNVKYWRTTSKAEVDFVLTNENEVIPIEVKSLGTIGRSFLNFINTYKPKRGIVFTERNFGLKNIKNTEVLFIPHWMI